MGACGLAVFNRNFLTGAGLGCCRKPWGAPWPLLGRLKLGGCQGTGRAAELLQAARGPPGPLYTVRAGLMCCGLPVALLGRSLGRQSWADARAPGRAGEPLRASCGLLGPSWAALEENEVLTLTKPGNILNVAKEW